MNKKNNLIRFIVPITYIIMISTNILANALPINGITTGEISDSYSNLFAPIGITFAIWGLIYLLLFIYSINQFFKFNKVNDKKQVLFNKIGILFSLSSIANTIWIFAWHYDIIWLSLLLMIIILIILIKINLYLCDFTFSNMELFLIRAPFTIYFGWITIATIANVVTFLVSISWNRFALSEILWMGIIILIGAIVGFISIIYYKSYLYGLVLLWAYLGILVKHISEEFLNGLYPSIIISILISIFIIIVGEFFLYILNKKKNINNNHQGLNM